MNEIEHPTSLDGGNALRPAPEEGVTKSESRIRDFIGKASVFRKFGFGLERRFPPGLGAEHSRAAGLGGGHLPTANSEAP